MEAAYDQLIERQAQLWLQQGKVSNTYSELPFTHRLAALAEELSDEMYDTELREFIGYLDRARLDMEEAVAFFRNDKLLDAVESIVGPEISFNPINHVRPYVPARTGGRDEAARNSADRGKWPHGPEEQRWSCHPMATWHMDQAVTAPEADTVDILTAWVAMVETTIENGCLQILPDVAPARELVTGHHANPGDAWPGATPRNCLMKRGDVLLLSSYTPHQSTFNISNHVRCAHIMHGAG